MNKFFSISLLFYSVTSIFGSLDANMPQSCYQEQHIPLGSRANDSEMVLQEYMERVDEELTLNENKQQEMIEVTGMGQVTNAIYPYVYPTSHKGAYHKPIVVGSEIELEDGSIWTVHPSSVYTVLSWLPTDIVVITPNYHWFSIYDYKLINQNTGASVPANMSKGPIYNGICTHWIVGIDQDNRTIILEDGSVWNTSSFDDPIIKKWMVNDTVIIGINSRWFSGDKCNVLINVETLTHAACKCINSTLDSTSNP